jgi:hypothetical protein
MNVYEAIADGSFEEVSHGDQGGSVRSALNVPLGEMAAARLAVYYHHLPGFIDAIQPGGSVNKDVNDGDRSGARLALLLKPTDELSITPRIVYQNLTTNGFPRVDLYNILANPYAAVNPVSIGPISLLSGRRRSDCVTTSLPKTKACCLRAPLQVRRSSRIPTHPFRELLTTRLTQTESRRGSS